MKRRGRSRRATRGNQAHRPRPPRQGRREHGGGKASRPTMSTRTGGVVTTALSSWQAQFHPELGHALCSRELSGAKLQGPEIDRFVRAGGSVVKVDARRTELTRDAVGQLSRFSRALRVGGGYDSRSRRLIVVYADFETSFSDGNHIVESSIRVANVRVYVIEPSLVEDRPQQRSPCYGTRCTGTHHQSSYRAPAGGASNH